MPTGSARPQRRPRSRPRPRRPRTSEPSSQPDQDDDERGPLRRCIVTRERSDPLTMLRFVVAPDLTLVPDLARKLPGRGIWLSARADVLETARMKGGFARAARGKVVVPANIASTIQTGLTRRIVELLGLARRAGQAVCGFTRCREMIVAGRCELVLGARDGSADERERLVSGAAGLNFVSPLDAAALGAVFGRDHIVHVAIAPGRLAGSVAIESGRLSGLTIPSAAGRTFKRAGA